MFTSAAFKAQARVHRFTRLQELPHRGQEEAGLPLDTRNLLNLPTTSHGRENMKVDGGRNCHSVSYTDQGLTHAQAL